MRCIINFPVAVRAVRASRVRPASGAVVTRHHLQNLSFHSTTTAAADSSSSSSSSSNSNSNQALSTSSPTTTSLRDPELDPQYWGYRVVLPGNTSSSSSSSSNSRWGNRTYATSSMSPASINYSEDYDDYTLYGGGPSENVVQCDLGAVVVNSSEDGFHPTILQFDDAGLVRPIWEQTGSVLVEDNNDDDDDDDTKMKGRDSSEQSPANDESVWTMQSHNDNRSHDTLEPTPVPTNGI